jgi:hypothetical protein
VSDTSVECSQHPLFNCGQAGPPRRISFGSSRLTPNRCNIKELPCVCAFRFTAVAVRRHDTHHPWFVPVQDRSDARRQIAWPRSALAAGRRAAARLPPLADPADARAHVVTGGFIRCTVPQGREMFGQAIRRRSRHVRRVIDPFRSRRGPQGAVAVGVAKLETGSAVLTRTGADARMISTVNPDGLRVAIVIE